MLYIAPAIVLAPSFAAEAWQPLVLWRNAATDITSDEEDTNYPASNLLNTQTSSLWKSGSTDPFSVTVAVDSDEPFGGFAWARHNFGSSQASLSVYGITADEEAEYELLAELVPGDDKVILGDAGAAYYTSLRFDFVPGIAAPQAAVLYVGSVLRVPRGIPPGHAPLDYARERTKQVSVAENGDFLGDLVLSERLATPVELKDVDADWHFENLQPLIDAQKPFFYCGFPTKSEGRPAFVKLTNDPKPSYPYKTGAEVDLSLHLLGLAL